MRESNPDDDDEGRGGRATGGDEHNAPRSDDELLRLRREVDRLRTLTGTQAWELNLLRARFARYEVALRGSLVTVYTQDRDLRYTSISNPMLGRSIERIVGYTDRDLFPAEAAAALIAIKREAIETGQARRTEVALDDASGPRWHDVHIEPLRNDNGDIVGLTCASVDVTERKEDEAHLRLLLRELTHRSKNLLAVIQAMARRTARYVGSIDAFLTQFSSRLQALAASHDLLVRESWHGASLGELVQSQLAAYMAEDGGQVMTGGPDVALRPEAAQNIGLALHELASNAAKFGALSVPGGRVSIAWERDDTNPQHALTLDWREQAGPRVRGRRKKGFGSLVIEDNLARALDAEVALDFEPDGLHCRIAIPASELLPAR